MKPEWAYVWDFSEGLALVRFKSKREKKANGSEELLELINEDQGVKNYGFIDKTGKVVISNLVYDHVTSFSDGMALVSNELGSGFIDKSGKLLLGMYPADFDSFNNGVSRFLSYDNFRFGFIDKNGKIIIKPQFQSISNFSDGLARFLKDKKFGFVDSNFKTVIDPQYDDSIDFNEGYCIVYKNGVYMIIDKAGKILYQTTSIIHKKFVDGALQFSEVLKKGYIVKR